MPEEGVDLTPKNELLTTEEIGRLARIFASRGVNKIRLTGGEPLVRSDIEAVVSDLSSIQGIKEVTMTTNGIVLSRKLPGMAFFCIIVSLV